MAPPWKAPLRVSVLVFVIALATRAGAGPLHVEGGRFVDAQSGTVILRGFDVAGNSKVPPFRAVTPDQLAPLPGWGTNVVRLLFTWEAYEPARGAYDESYLAYIEETVDALAALGVFVIVDVHQDAFSRASIGGCGEGFPLWTLPPTVTPATPDNGPACADWGPRMLGDAPLATTWDAFFADTGGVRSAYLTMIGRVAAALAGRPNVIGYDLLNEPGGDEPTQLAPLYDDAARAVRAADPTAIVFVSPKAITSAGLPTRLPPPAFTNFAYAPHYYDPLVAITGAWDGTKPTDAFDQMATQAAALGGALFVGEFGASGPTERAGDLLLAFRHALDAHLASGAQWVYTPGWTPTAFDGWNREDFSIVDDTGALRANFAPIPAPQRVAGVPTAFVFDEKKETLRLDWTHDPAAGATVLYLPPAWAAPAPAIDAPDLTCQLSVDASHAGHVTCTSASGGPRTLRISAGPRCGLGGEALWIFAFLAAVRRIRVRAHRKRRQTV